MIAGYAPLKEAVKDMLARSDISDTAFDVFITVVEEEVCAAIQPRELDTLITLFPAIGDDPFTVPLPADYRLARVVKVGNQTFMQVSQRQFMDSSAGPVFTIIGNKLHLGDAYGGGEVKLLYSKRIPHLDSANLTNDIITHYPSIYLYGCLREACKYIDDKAKAQVYQAAFDTALETAGVDADQARYSGSELIYSGDSLLGGM